MYHMVITLDTNEVMNAYGLCIHALIDMVERLHGDHIVSWTVKRV